MKTFKDLEFGPHPVMSGLAARMNFDNGYGISVIRFKHVLPGFDEKDLYGSYTSNEKEWECAVLKNDALNYDSGLTQDVIGHLTDDEVTDFMKKIQELK